MFLKRYMTSMLMPPVGACRYGCGTSCAAPVTVFWLFGVVSIIYGFLGGPVGAAGISWYTVGLGLAMWGIAAIWTMLTMQGSAADRCQPVSGKSENENDPFDKANEVH